MRIDRIKLIAEMARQNLTVKELAEKACVSRMTVSSVRSGKSVTRHIARALGVELDALKEEV